MIKFIGGSHWAEPLLFKTQLGKAVARTTREYSDTFSGPLPKDFLEVAAPEIYEKYSDQALKDDPWRFPRWKTPEKRLEKPSRALKDDP